MSVLDNMAVNGKESAVCEMVPGFLFKNDAETGDFDMPYCVMYDIM